MEENIIYGFFDQLPIAFFQPQKYKFFLGKKKRFYVGFIAIIVTLIVLMDYVIPFTAWSYSVGGLENLVTKGIPSFSLENGVFNIESPLDIEISGMIHLKADSSMDRFEQKDLGDSYLEEFLISKNNMIMRHSSMVYEVRFDEMKDYKMNNQSLVEMLPMVKISGIITLIFMILLQAVLYLGSALFFGLLCSVGIRSPEGKRMKFSEVFIFSIYGRSLFIILTSLNTCMGYWLPSSLMFILGSYLTMRWIVAAEQSYFGIKRKSLFKRDDDSL